MTVITTAPPCSENRQTFEHTLPYLYQQSAARHIWTQPSLRLPAVGHQTQHLDITFLPSASSRPLDTTFGTYTWTMSYGLYVFHVQYADIHGWTLLNQALVAYARKQSICFSTSAYLSYLYENGVASKGTATRFISHVTHDIPPSQVVRNSLNI
jgi:hypothetical protein